MKTYTTIERQPTAIPIEEVVGAKGTVDIFPEVKQKGYFELDFQKGKLVVVSGKFIGHIPLNADVLIDVRPKVGVGRLGRILERAQEPLKCLDFYRRAYKTEEIQADSIFEVLVRALIAAVREVAQEGVLREYTRREEDLSTVRGRIRGLDTIRRLHSRGLFSRVSCRYYDLAIDHPLNRLIKYALWYSARHLIAKGAKDKKLPRELSGLYQYFDPVPLDLSMQFIDEARSYLAKRHLPSIRSYYLSACDAAFAVISDSGLDLLGEGRDIHLASFLVDMETVFEQYVRNVLKEAPLILEDGLSVLDGNSEAKDWLFGDTKVHEAKPDIVVKRDAEVRLIGDVKYKPKLSEHDRYQVISHALSYGARRSFIVMPAETTKDEGMERIGRVGSAASGIDLYVYRINLEADDLSAEEMTLANAVRGLAAP